MPTAERKEGKASQRLTANDSCCQRAPTIVGLSIVGYGAKVYIDSVREKRERMLEAQYQEDRERQRRNDMLMDVYGDRESLEGLEKAIQFYESGKK
ncbi:hypothetical protein ISF_09111 [Cordyceps fumosorosea ARSEF 2679]|uniref:Uncharacterized protein n=1 Tax=Cordyceps fumosorosea (strain ARSEF 2679) TaxID=1081104 RepID=A0A162K400_CORFA|nr:hypothetical protein ISF_09111 [Cordyceps fumosorosea ARSEF 2679]OAA53048.1 hypothetical protein ISF_09111 [Cordyceps fumosorosea ARSEF 2679]